MDAADALAAVSPRTATVSSPATRGRTCTICLLLRVEFGRPGWEPRPAASIVHRLTRDTPPALRNCLNAMPNRSSRARVGFRDDGPSDHDRRAPTRRLAAAGVRPLRPRTRERRSPGGLA